MLLLLPPPLVLRLLLFLPCSALPLVFLRLLYLSWWLLRRNRCLLRLLWRFPLSPRRRRSFRVPYARRRCRSILCSLCLRCQAQL